MKKVAKCDICFVFNSLEKMFASNQMEQIVSYAGSDIAQWYPAVCASSLWFNVPHRQHIVSRFGTENKEQIDLVKDKLFR